ncbi:putative lipoprotein [Mycoplasma sp. CAG:877]|nr:putative lipoprotein [Mycoplasma sp. CAG:877]
MKKILFSIMMVLLLVSGCGKNSETSVINDLEKKINKASAYKVTGVLEIVNNDEVYTYDVEVSYKKDNNYKVSLTNQANNHTQVILKNSDGVYVLTPALNKSFKFQSDWPYSNSQVYLLKSLINDIKDTKDRGFKDVKSGYSLSTKVNYPNNSKLVKQTIELDKNGDLKKVSVYDSNNIICMTMTFDSIDYSPTFKKDYFNLDSVMSTYSISEEEVKETTMIDDTIYPLVIPNGTKLVSEEKIKKDVGDRIIMTFDGDKPFLLVEETAVVEDEFTVIPTYGEPFQLMDTLGVMTNNSLTWTSNGIEYYIVSDVLNQNELVEVAQSISYLPTMK